VSGAVQTNWDLMMQHHAGEWKGVWTGYAVAPPSSDTRTNTEPVTLTWASERRRVVSLIESQNKGESVNYVDMDLGGWDDAIDSTLPDDYSSAPRATLPSRVF